MTSIPTQLLVKLTTKPKGTAIILKISVLNATSIPVKVNMTNATKNAGISAVNDLETPSGTASGILIIHLRFTHNLYNCTAIIDIIIAVNSPDVPSVVTPAADISQPLNIFIS